MSSAYAPAVAPREIPGRGVGLIATRDIAAGECVLRERAIVCGTSVAFRDSACARCLAFTAPDGAPLFTCATCGLAKLCGGDTCAWSGMPHGKVACHAEGLAKGLPPPDVERLRFLAACADLRGENSEASVARLNAVEALCPAVGPNGENVGGRELDAARRLHPLLETAVARALAGSQIAPIADADAFDATRRAVAGSVFDAARLLAKETKNAFGAMAPRDVQSGERRVRGGALYDLASRVNHDCFPNVARFDNFDGALEKDAFVLNRADENVARDGVARKSLAPDELRLIALDRIPAGAEVTMSYLPVTEPLPRRRRRLRHTFEFECSCQRCRVEMRWAREDGDRVGDVDEETDVAGGRCFSSSSGASDSFMETLTNAMDDEDDERMAALSPEELERRSDRVTPEYAVWFMRNVCPVTDCGGTLAPPNATATHMTCNACGYKRTDEAFYAQLRGEEV
jgi:SET and MYND domain-containing protein